MDMSGCVWVRESFFKQWQVTDKIIEWFLFTIHILHFPNDTNQSQGFENSQIDMPVWVGGCFLMNDKWQIKLLSQFFPIWKGVKWQKYYWVPSWHQFNTNIMVAWLNGSSVGLSQSTDQLTSDGRFKSSKGKYHSMWEKLPSQS